MFSSLLSAAQLYAMTWRLDRRVCDRITYIQHGIYSEKWQNVTQIVENIPASVLPVVSEEMSRHMILCIITTVTILEPKLLSLIQFSRSLASM